MKQVIANLKDGHIDLIDVPTSRPGSCEVLIQTKATLISSGTERMLIEFGRAGWLDKARQQPDKVRLLLDKIRTDGLLATWDTVRSRIDQPLALGYCQIGRVCEVGAKVMDLALGDRVVSNGPHAEFVRVPRHLCARIPPEVTDDEAVFTIPAAIGLQGIRLVKPTLGESVVVIGLGLIGLLTVQIFLANGCRVLGLDPDPERLALAEVFGAEVGSPDPEGSLAQALEFSSGRGIDAVIIAASTPDSGPMHLAARMCRKRGRIVLVGVTGLELSRSDFYEKELSFRVSCSYGPGRYDPAYEIDGQDYPMGFVRWTAQRNFEAVLGLMATKRLACARLISHRFPLDEVRTAYDRLTSGEPQLGLILEYPCPEIAATATPCTLSTGHAVPHLTPSGDRLAVLGAGNYGRRILIPAFRRAGGHLVRLVSSGGMSAAHIGHKMGFEEVSTDTEAAIRDLGIDVVVIATRHHLHAREVILALQAGKHVFCEKPLCLTLTELESIETAIRARPDRLLMVGFNRRFAPLVREISKRLSGLVGPRHCIVTVNAGRLEPGHWAEDPEIGGGRIVGEACHFIDLIRFLVGAPITRAHGLAGGRGEATLHLGFADGSTGTVHYLTHGHRSFPKERLEVFCAGRVLELDNFCRLRGWGFRAFRTRRLWRQDKGQKTCVATFLETVRQGLPSPIPLEEILEVSRISIELQKTLRPDP